MVNKKILLDTETTGVNLLKNDVWQVAGYVIIDDKIVDKFNIKFQPRKGTEFSKGALEKTKMSPEDFEKFQPNKDGIEEFLKILNKYVNKFDKKDKFHLVAYNAHFDAQFLRKWFEQYKNRLKSYYGSYFWSNNIDIMTLASEALFSIRDKMQNFQLATVHNVLAQIGLFEAADYENAHDAFFDIGIEYDIYKLFCFNNIVETTEKINKLKKGK
jgi:DNA polymerase-3 subunit epsilon